MFFLKNSQKSIYFSQKFSLFPRIQRKFRNFQLQVNNLILKGTIRNGGKKGKKYLTKQLTEKSTFILVIFQSISVKQTISYQFIIIFQIRESQHDILQPELRFGFFIYVYKETWSIIV